MRRIALLLTLPLLFLTQQGNAQTITGAITGTVSDQTGAVVPNAKVTATNVATNVSTTAVTNDAGIYNLLFLPVGQYRISTEASGFKLATVPPFQLEVNQTARVDVQLQVGQTTETIEVTAAAPILQTESTEGEGHAWALSISPAFSPSFLRQRFSARAITPRSAL